MYQLTDGSDVGLCAGVPEGTDDMDGANDRVSVGEIDGESWRAGMQQLGLVIRDEYNHFECMNAMVGLTDGTADWDGCVLCTIDGES